MLVVCCIRLWSGCNGGGVYGDGGVWFGVVLWCLVKIVKKA